VVLQTDILCELQSILKRTYRLRIYQFWVIYFVFIS
jgi:hypothetical protein